MLPIMIMSFDRPQYLEPVLVSLRAQTNFVIDEKRVFFFQDGAINKHSNQQYTSKDITDTCASVFKKYFPGGNLLISPSNIGVALNFERAERLAFEILEADAAYFLEDDMLLGRNYMSSMEHMLDIGKNNSAFGYFAAYGDHRASREDQIRNNNKIIAMDHNWAFGLTRRQWMAQKVYVDQYLSIVRTNDYRKRNPKAVAQLMHSWGYRCPGTSQDAAKTIACLKSGGTKLNTYICLAKYIGEHGLHSNTIEFRKMGFDKADFVVDGKFEGSIDDADYEKSRSYMNSWAMNDVVKPD